MDSGRIVWLDSRTVVSLFRAAHCVRPAKRLAQFECFAPRLPFLPALLFEDYTSPLHLGIEGYSNGGLLTAASILQHPRLFGAAYVGHGVLDMLRYQKFSGGAFWVPEYGSSDSESAFRWLIRYSPLQNIRTGECYPPTLITTSWDDDRVVSSNAFKFAPKLQRAEGCNNPILL